VAYRFFFFFATTARRRGGSSDAFSGGVLISPPSLAVPPAVGSIVILYGSAPASQPPAARRRRRRGRGLGVGIKPFTTLENGPPLIETSALSHVSPLPRPECGEPSRRLARHFPFFLVCRVTRGNFTLIYLQFPPSVPIAKVPQRPSEWWGELRRRRRRRRRLPSPPWSPPACARACVRAWQTFPKGKFNAAAS